MNCALIMGLRWFILVSKKNMYQSNTSLNERDYVITKDIKLHEWIYGRLLTHMDRSRLFFELALNLRVWKSESKIINIKLLFIIHNKWA